MRTRRLIGAAATALALLVTAACGTAATPAAQDPDALVVYNAQHESMTKVWADAYTAATGVPVVLRNGKDFELANQITAEGAASPADVFLTENSPAMSLVESAGLFAPVDASTLAQVPKRWSTSTGNWVGIAARSTVFVYNTSKLSKDQLPTSLLDLQKPEWQGRWGAAPGGADFQAIMSALVQLEGEEKAAAWLSGMKTNAKIYSNNITTLQGVNAGEVEGGIIYHYYWYRDQAKTKENSGNTALLYFGDEDPGAFVSVSGGGVLKTAKHATQAQQFLAFITGPQGQQALADSEEYEYTVGSGVAANQALKPLADLDAPLVDPSTLNGPTVIDLMTSAGLI